MMSLGVNPWFLDELKRRVEAQVTETATGMTNGGCQDYPDYRYQVGRVAGLRDALDLAEEIRKEQDRA